MIDPPISSPTETPVDRGLDRVVVGLNGDDARSLYRLMRLMAVVDDRVRREVTSGRLKAATYSIRGLEGACAALGVAMQRRDWLVSTYRSLGDALAKNAELDGILGEYFGKASGVSKGKGGTMHLHDQGVGFVTSTGIVGSGLPIATGLGMAAQLDGDGRAVVCTFGDGATSIGAFHEALNLASLWHLPVVFVCQNNQWAEYTPIDQYAGSTDLCARAASYGAHAVSVDGFDPVATLEVLRPALENARSGTGPVFVEIQTYRLASHSGVGDNSYVPADRLAEALGHDPLPTFRDRLLREGVADVHELDDIDREVTDVAEAAFAHAGSASHPGPEERFRDVYAEPGTGEPQ